MKQMSLWGVTVLILVTCRIYAVEEVESNETYQTATFAKGSTKLTGTLEMGRDDHDFFLLDPFLAVNSLLRLEARIISGPNAGKEGFGLTVYQDAAQNVSYGASSTGQGYLLYAPQYGEFVGTPLYVEIHGTVGGDYEIDVNLTSIDRERPKIQFKGRRIGSNGRKSFIDIETSDGSSLLKKVVVRAPGNRPGKIRMKGNRVRIRNLTGRLPREPLSVYRARYEFDRSRPNMRVRVLAMDADGKKSVRSVRFR